MMHMIGMAEPQQKARLNPKMTRKASRGLENLNWGMIEICLNRHFKSHQLN